MVQERLQRPAARVAGFLLAFVLVVTAAYVAGRGVATDRSLRIREGAPVVTAAVRSGPLRESVIGSARVAPAHLTAISVPALPSGYLPVVTALPPRPGSRVEAGSVVAAVADRPILVLAGRLPAYRAMTLGDRGPDVAQLRKGLEELGLLAGAPPGDRYDRATASAVARLYVSRGYRPLPRDGTAIPLGEVVFVPRLPARVLSVEVALGATVGEGPLMTIADPDARLIGIVPSIDAARLARGQAASVTFPDGRTLQARVEGLLPGATTPPDAEGSPTASGNEGVSRVELSPLGPVPRDLMGAEGTLTVVVGESSSSSLVVPVTAVYQGTDGSTWVVVVSGERRRRVDVRLGLAAAGEVVVNPIRGSLEVGERVVVSARNEG